MTNWIFFDVGSTLVDETVTYQRFAAECAGVLSNHGQAVTATAFFEKMKELAEAGDAPIRNAWAWYGLPASMRPRWNHEGETLYPDVISTLDTLSQSYRLGIIANQASGLEKRLEAFGIRQFFDIVIGSEDVGCKKPNRAIFEVALEKASSLASDCIYIGDRMDNDIIPAQEVGMRTIQILQGLGPHRCQETDMTADMTIQSLSKLVDLL